MLNDGPERVGVRGWSDAASLIKRASLAHREGTSDKVYEVDLE